MRRKVIAIRAIGTRGKVKGKPFIAERREGKYVLHSEHLAAKTGRATRFAANKVLVDTLNEAVELLNAGGYHIRVFNKEYNQWNLRMKSEVEIEYA
jgi:hypothetical protein